MCLFKLQPYIFPSIIEEIRHFPNNYSISVKKNALPLCVFGPIKVSVLFPGGTHLVKNLGN